MLRKVRMTFFFVLKCARGVYRTVARFEVYGVCVAS